MKAQPASFCAGEASRGDDEERAARGHRLLDLSGEEGGAELELGILRHVVEEGRGRVDHRHLAIDEVGVGNRPGVVVLARRTLHRLVLVHEVDPELERLRALLAEGGLLAVGRDERATRLMEEGVPEPPVHGHLEAVGLDLAALAHRELGRGVAQLVPRRGNLHALGGQHVGVVVEDGRGAEEGQGHEGRRRLAQVVEVRVLGLSGQIVFEVRAVRALGVGLEVLEEAGGGELRNGLTDDVEGGGRGLGRRGRADLGEGLEVVALVRSLDPVLGLRLVEPLDVGLGHLAVRAPKEYQNCAMMGL